MDKSALTQPVQLLQLEEEAKHTKKDSTSVPNLPFCCFTAARPVFSGSKEPLFIEFFSKDACQQLAKVMQAVTYMREVTHARTGQVLSHPSISLPRCFLFHDSLMASTAAAHSLPQPLRCNAAPTRAACLRQNARTTFLRINASCHALAPFRRPFPLPSPCCCTPSACGPA